MDFTESQIRKSKPVVINRINKKTLIVSYYSGVHIDGQEFPFSDEGKDPKPCKSYDEALKTATKVVNEIKEKFKNGVPI